MTTERLLLPRYEVIADFWDNPFKVGEIIEFEQESDYHDFFTGELLGRDWKTDFLPKGNEDVTRYMYNMRAFTPYPHLFKKLQWWEHRKIEEMPMYLKETGMVDDNDNPIPDWYVKVKKHFNAGNGEWRDNSIHIFCTEDHKDGWNKGNRSMSYSNFEPATEQEYLDYINKK
jgi:hypothetical protein